MGKSQFVAENTSIDGVKEMLSTKESIKLRFCWIVVWLSCNALMGFVLWKVIVEYTENPTVTVVESKIPDSFPELTVCPITWMNVSNARAIGFDQISDYCIRKNFGAKFKKIR